MKLKYVYNIPNLFGVVYSLYMFKFVKRKQKSEWNQLANSFGEEKY